jgi:hypothetical protein
MGGLTTKESREKILQITQEVIPTAGKKQAGNLLKGFGNRYFPTMEMREVARTVINSPLEYKIFCERIRKTAKLQEHEFNYIINQIERLSLEQLEILAEKVSLELALSVLNKQNTHKHH